MMKQRKKRTSAPEYVSPNQLTLEGFETPFEQSLNPKNRWVVMAHMIPWDEISNLYLKHVGVSSTGRPPINPRVVIGSVIIKHMCNLDDRETVDQISENVYMQYFLGYSSFTNQAPFDASLFVEFRKRLGSEQINAINERIISLKATLGTKQINTHKSDAEDNDTPDSGSNPGYHAETAQDEKQHAETPTINKGRLLMDATACPPPTGGPFQPI